MFELCTTTHKIPRTSCFDLIVTRDLSGVIKALEVKRGGSTGTFSPSTREAEAGGSIEFEASLVYIVVEPI